MSTDLSHTLEEITERQLPGPGLSLSPVRSIRPEVVIPVAALTALVVTICAYMHSQIVDDGFIYMRVVDNLLSKGEWGFNPGVRQNPCSGPLFVFLLMLPRSIGLSPELSISLLHGSGLLGAALLLKAGLSYTGKILPFAAALVLLCNTTLITSIGMETSWYIFLLISVAYAYQMQSPRFLTISLAALILLRLDGLLMVPALLLIELVRRKRLMWKPVGIAVLPLLIWFFLSQIYFGDFLPHSIRIKMTQSQIGWWKEQDPFLVHFTAGALYPLVGCVLALLGIFTSVSDARRSKTLSVVLVCFGLLQTAAYSVSEAPAGYFWYNAPGHLAWNLSCLFGIGTAITIAQAFYSQRLPLLKKFSSVAGANRTSVFMLASLFALTTTELGAQAFRGVSRQFDCSSQYRAAGQWLSTHTEKEARIAAVEIGYLGYYSQREIIDVHGIIHPSAFQRVLSDEKDWWFQDQRADYIVAHNPPWPNEPTSDPEWWPPDSWEKFQTDYHPVAHFDSVIVYQRSVREQSGSGALSGRQEE